MKIIIKVILISISLSYIITPQQYDYWKNASAVGSRIYSICFTDQQNGYAVSTKGEIFESSDSGNTWFFRSQNLQTKSPVNKNILWSADIYCSVMQTNDGGLSWSAYDKEAQEHFCGVYLKDNNSGYKIANEFLNKVTAKIFASYREDEFTKLINQPQQCTEYYSNEKDGWAIGWCLKNFNQYKNTK